MNALQNLGRPFDDAMMIVNFCSFFRFASTIIVEPMGASVQVAYGAIDFPRAARYVVLHEGVQTLPPVVFREVCWG